ncbi:MAG TPA: prolyl oligopeptidase family serine peptidase, partial [Acidobacteriota bacterium]
GSTKRNQKDFDLYLMDGIDPKSTRLLKQTEGYWAAADWSADDSLVLLMNYIAADDSRLHIINPKTKAISQINASDKKISYGSFAFARDRNGVYYTSDEDSEFIRLTYYDLSTGKKEILTPDLKWDVSELAVSKDGKWIAYSTNEGGVSKVYLAPTSSLNAPQLVPLPKGVASGLKFDSLDRRLGFSLNTSQSPTDVYSIDLSTGKLDKWTSSEVGGLNRSRFVTPELIEYPTFDEVDGKPRKIPSFYFKPAGASKQAIPVVIDFHGGPEGQTDASFSYLVQYWVNELGVAVLQPNVRGSTGYGKSYQKLDNESKREDSVKDIGKLLDWIALQPELDSSRIAVFGGSYGGYMVLSSMFHYNDRLRCGIDVVGISNFVTFLTNTEDYRRDLRRVEYGDERDPAMRKFLESISPTTNAGKIR